MLCIVTKHAKRPGGSATTDAELIHDEVENQLSQCQCRRQFAATKFGEGKYKVRKYIELTMHAIIKLSNNEKQ